MSDAAAQNGTQAASTGEAAAVAATTGAKTAAAAAPVAAAAAPAAPVPAAAPAAPLAAPVAAAAVAQPAPAPAAEECAPPKKKVAHKHSKKETEEEHARLADSDEDQNLSQPADGCVLPQTGQTAAPAPQDGGSAPMMADDVSGGGISSGLLIGAGVLAAVGVGVLALAKDDEEPNVPPTANADTGAVNEGATLTGSVATNDTDSNNDVLTYAITGTAPAGLTLSSNGSYTFDANNAAYNSLAVGATQTVTANYSVSDNRGGTSSSTLTITITGANDAPVAVADTGPASTEGGAAVTGTVATNDSDPDTGAVLSFSLVDAVAGLTLNSNGTYSFNPADPAYNSLAAGQTQTVVANYRVTDAQGASSTSTLTLVVTGTNDAPTAVADTGAVAEGATLTGSVATNDTDPDQNATLTYTLNAPVAGLTLNANGSYTFDANNAAYNSLAVGATQVVTANYTVTDGQGATSTSTLTITVTGTNDAPVAVADIGPGSTEGGAAVTGTVATNDSDPEGSALTFALVSPVAGLTLNNDGTYSFDPADPAYNGIAAGATQTVVANYRVTDAQGASSTSTLTLVVTGTNDAPTAAADIGAVNEGATLTGSVATNDTDPDQNDVLTYTLNAPVAGLTLNGNGTFSFDANNAAYSSLAAGATQVVTANYTVTDAAGAISTSTLTITVTGTNDAPVAVADTGPAATEGGAAVTGTVATNDSDPDTGAVLTYSLNAPVAGLTLNGDGSYSFDPANPAYNSLAAGQTQTVVANYTVRDAEGATSTSTLTLVVTGTNDAPVAVADTNSGREDTTITGSVATNDSDPDANSALTFALVGAAPAGFTLNSNGSYTLNTGDPAYQNLTAGQVQNVVVNYEVSDGQGGVVASTLTIAVTGVVETANLDIDDDASLATARLFEAGATDFIFTEDDNVANNVIVNQFGADDIITFDGAVGDYTFTSGDFDTDGVADDIRITSTVGGATSTLVLANSIAAGTAVANEAQAEAAIGTGVENFQFVVTSSLDADDDGNVLTARTFDASTASFRFTDDADTANTAVIAGFGTNDRIVLETGNSYSFSSTALQSDGDGIRNDLIVTLNKGGVVTSIVIKDAVSSSAVIFDEARAELALNQFLNTTNVDYFQFG